MLCVGLVDGSEGDGDRINHNRCGKRRRSDVVGGCAVMWERLDNQVGYCNAIVIVQCDDIGMAVDDNIYHDGL